MRKEHMDYWYDKDGNKVYGNKKHYNKCFEFLLSDDPQEVACRTGVKIRKVINPLYRNAVPLTSKNKFIIEQEPLPKTKRPIIFACTHGFRDDVALSIKTAGTSAYLLYASIPDFYYSVDGLALWAGGVVMMDRKDPQSRKSAIPKMKKVIELGGNILMFPEGVWNKSKNDIVLKLFPGIYRLAKETNAIIVPIASLQVGDKCYSKRLEAFDIIKYEEKEGLSGLRDILATGKYSIMEKHPMCPRKTIGDEQEYWDKYLEELVASANGLYDYEIENSAAYVDSAIVTEEQVFGSIKKL